MDEEFHLGHIIFEEIKRQNHTVKWFAEQINCERTNCYCIFKRKYIDVYLLLRISMVLQHNFFRELAEHFESVIKISTEMS